MRLTGIGECMVELSRDAGSHYLQGFAGDVFNACYYYAALSPADGGATFISALGDDSFSTELLDFCREVQVDAQCTRETGSTLGLYLIQRDARGDRQFSYWRDAAPARRMIGNLSATQRQQVESAQLLLLSGVTLAILDDAQRETLRQLVGAMRRRGGLLAFDPNYRAALWESVDAARHWIDIFYALADIAFPGLDDERALFGVTTTPLDILGRAPLAAVPEVVVKAGENTVHGRIHGTHFRTTCAPVPCIVDTTAAGDAFNAAYLVARIRHLSPQVCAAYAARVAAAVIGQRGAIVDAALLPKLEARVSTE
ncbi:MAG TPA: sugar kinase [Spongiibacteraceae bacterium]|nr:sugar kinase [Spongiibacteraceae bacterium]